VNFHLRVVGVRPDGYHLLESVMAPVALFDRVTLVALPRATIRLHCSDPALPTGNDNLAWRAAELLQRQTRTTQGVEIRLRKRIPAGAGLGGGSSDSAAVLRGLNCLWGLGLAPARLARIGAQLGADIPFFVHGRPAVVRGIGERVWPLLSFPPSHLVIVWPGFAISTRWAYQRLDRGRRSAPLVPAPGPSVVDAFRRGRRSLRECLANDLQAVARQSHPRLASLARDVERAGAQGTLVTGSGSALFGLFPSRAAARRAAASLARRGLWSVAAHTLGESPPPVLRWR
jgi:4-diphosphocytidyl-2-C-methyl-D-erythritol kinase